MAVLTDDEVKLSCCTTWQHPAARLLLGEHLHPGGRDLTEASIEAIGAAPGDVVLDVGCGPGTSLRLMKEQGIHSVGIDLSVEAVREASDLATVMVGDGQRLPFSAGSVDGALLECVLSLLLDKPRALQDLNRVLRPGARVAVSDVVIERRLALGLEGAAAWSCCIGGAASRQGYGDMISDSGLEVVGTKDHSEALTTTIEKVRRRLSLFQLAAAASELDLEALGTSPEGLERARTVAAGLLEEIRTGALGYVLIIAEKPAS